MKTFLIEDFFHLPPVSMTLVVHFELRISPQIFEKNLNDPNVVIRRLGETDPCRKPKVKNLVALSLSLHFCPQVGPDGTWSNIWPDTELNKGDTIYYWYYLVIDKKGYQVRKSHDLPPLWNCSVGQQFFMMVCPQWGRIMVANFLIKSILFNRLVPMFQSISSRDTIPFKRAVIGWTD
jgi:hypothetical protein